MTTRARERTLRPATANQISYLLRHVYLERGVKYGHRVDSTRYWFPVECLTCKLKDRVPFASDVLRIILCGDHAKHRIKVHKPYERQRDDEVSNAAIARQARNARIIDLRNEGKSLTAIASEVGVSRSTVIRVVSKMSPLNIKVSVK